jgi:amidase
MARTVADAAVLLGALTGVDPRDPATSTSRGAQPDYSTFLDPDGLRGARLGVVRNYFGFDPRVDRHMEEALDVLRRQGAILIDPVLDPTKGDYRDSEYEVLLYEFKADLNQYLQGLGEKAPVRSLDDVIAFNERHRDRVMPYFGQETMEKAAAKGPLTDPAYRRALAKNHRLTRRLGIDAMMQAHRLDALVAPTGGPAWLTDLVKGDHFGGGFSSAAAVAGYPHLTVPNGYILGLPVGISFYGRRWSEGPLIRLAFAYEQATRHRRPPTYLSTLALP